MKKALILSITIIISLVLFSSVTSPARAQDTDGQRGRGLKIKVGARQGEVNANIDLWAVLIGVSRYEVGDQDLEGYRIANLKNAADDAQAIYDFLKSPEGGGFRDEKDGGHMILLKDEQATKASVERALANIKQAKPDDYFVLYIAAHGALVPYRAPGSNTTVDIPYFLLYDSDLRKPQETMMKMDIFRQTVSEIPAKKGLVLSDTCHSGGVQLAGRDTSNTSIRANSRYIEEMNSVASGVGFISAADQLEQSFERDDLNQGVFTYIMLQGLSGDADTNFDGKVTFNELAAYLRDEVPKLTENKQHPKANTTAIEANFLPLSVVSYAEEVAATGNPDDYGLLVIRTPDIDGVNVAIGGKPFATFNAGTQRAVMVKAGTCDLSFTKGELKRTLKASVEAGKPKIVEVNLTFSESDDDALVAPTDRVVGVYLPEEREPLKAAKDLFVKGVESFNKQKFDDAIEQFDRAAQANGGGYADAFVYRGRAEQSLGRKEAAVGSFKAALQLRPSDFETETLLAEAKFNAGYNVEEVVSSLRNIIRRHPNFDYARVVYGDVLLARKDFAAAELQLRRAITINPKSPPAHLILADILTYQESSQKQKRAVEEAEKALELLKEVSRKQVSAARGLRRLSISHIIFGGGRYINEPALAETHHILAKALTRLVERDLSMTDPDTPLDRARVHITEALELAEKFDDKRRLVLVLDTSAQNHLLKGNISMAISDAEKALKLSEKIPDMKDFHEAHYTLYTAYTSDQRFSKASEHLQKFIQMAGSQLSPTERQTLDAELKRIKRMKDANRQKN
ncbi:MAG: caspase family protein [Blastocatellia bacterium]|nr:caspase family protein [Blastocatellia bacterium]